MKTWKSMGVVGVCLFSMGGCGDGGVGSEHCVGDAVRCRLPMRWSSPAPEQQELSTRDVPEIPMTWIRALPNSDDSDETMFVLTSDLEGDVWLFATERAGVAAMRLDADGNVAERTTIAPPRDVHVTNPRKTSLYLQQQSAVGATIKADWFLSEMMGSRTEWIRLGANIDDPLQRIATSPNDEDPVPWAGDQVAWAADGSRYVLRVLDWAVDKYDRMGRLEWRQAALGETEWPTGTEFWFGLTPDERVIVFGWEPESATLTVHVVSESGNIVRQAPAPGKVMVKDPDWYSPPTALVATSDEGDLYMWHVESDSARFVGAVVRREDYLLLNPAASAVDSRGTLYALTKTGGRDPADQRDLLCRVPVAGASSCVKLAPRPEFSVTQLAINADGVVFLRVGTQLARIDLAEP